MSKVHVDLTIKNEAISETVESEGTFIENTMEFHDEENRKHTLTFDNERLRYRRNGDRALDFTFEQDVLHEGTFQVLSQEMRFMVQTHELRIEEQSVFLRYTLLQAGQPVNHSELYLYYQEL